MIRILKFPLITYRYHLLCRNFVFSLVNHTSALRPKSAFLAIDATTATATKTFEKH